MQPTVDYDKLNLHNDEISTIQYLAEKLKSSKFINLYESINNKNVFLNQLKENNYSVDYLNLKSNQLSKFFMFSELYNIAN